MHRRLLAALLGLLVLVGACTNREPSQAQQPRNTGSVVAKEGPHGLQTATVTGNAQFRFQPSTIKAKPGRLRITLVITGGTPHDLEVEPMHANTGLVSTGQRKSVTVRLNHPGTYRFLCTLHSNLGMTGKIVVS